MDEKLDSWMDSVCIQKGLPENKGKIVAIGLPVTKTTRFGERKFSPFVIEGIDGTQLAVDVGLPAQFPQVHPKSTIGKLMYKLSCKTMHELIGKQVELIQTGETFWKIKTD